MTPKTRTLVFVAVAVVVVGAAAAWRFLPSFRPAPKPAPVTTVAPPKAPPGGLALEQDPAQVFQRAFWRRPAADDKILHAERRDWLDASSGVEKWQWFVAVQPGPAFREWFFKDNPFELVPIPADAPSVPLTSPPSWLPAASELARFSRYRNREGRFLVFHDLTTNRLFATDQGGGFAAARK